MANQRERVRERVHSAREGPGGQPIRERERERVIEIINKGWTIERERGTIYFSFTLSKRQREKKREKERKYLEA